MAETTPGPWFATTEDGNWIIRSEVEDRHSVAYVGHDSSETAAGDAELIAAAPALLAALTSLLLVSGHVIGCPSGTISVRPCAPRCAQARAALQLARGAS